MATDGPAPVEQPAPSQTGEKRGLFGLGRKKAEAKPAAAPQTPPTKEALPNKM